jgi:hypothetical protein
MLPWIMPALFRSSCFRPIRLPRRIALFALLALELVVALAPLMEPTHEATASHVEQTGTRHHFLVHDDANCAVCTLRSITALPRGHAVLLPTAAQAFVAPVRVNVATTTGANAANPSRAPPTAG